MAKISKNKITNGDELLEALESAITKIESNGKGCPACRNLCEPEECSVCKVVIKAKQAIRKAKTNGEQVET